MGAKTWVALGLLMVVTVSIVALMQSFKYTERTGIHSAAVGGSGAMKSEQDLLHSVRRLANAIKIIDGEIEHLSDRIAFAEDNVIAEKEGQPEIAPPPRQVYPSSDEHGDSIFVSIASFRDEECGPMIKDMYAQAENPKNIHIGIVEQHADNDPPCLREEFRRPCQHDVFCPTDNIRIRKIKPHEAKGPTFGRYVSMHLYRGQRYLLMMDSHNRFVPHWDTKLIKMHKSLNDKKAVLTHYPEAWRSDGDPLVRSTTSHLCRASYLHDYLKFEAVLVSAQEKPMPQPYSAAGFLFADATLIHEVPLDPHLPFLFDGEEVLYTVRMWTSGWNLYSPNSNIVFHFYGRPSAPKIWSEPGVQWGLLQQQSQRRVKYFLRSTNTQGVLLVPPNTTEKAIIIDEDRYGLGSARSLQDYYDYAGIDPIARKFKKNWCV